MREGDPVVLGVASAALLVVAFALLLGATSWPGQVAGGFAAAAGGYFAMLATRGHRDE